MSAVVLSTAYGVQTNRRARQQMKWKVDFEGVEKSVRESVARDIEAYRDRLLSTAETFGYEGEDNAFINIFCDQMAAIARDPEAPHRARVRGD